MPATENIAKPDCPVTEAVAALATPAAYVLAFSGGQDSSVLLHALAARRPQGLKLRAVHVDHALHAESAQWAQWCQQRCESLDVPFTIMRVPTPPPAGNREAWARQQRYALIQSQLAAGERVLTAHHRRDQAETVLLHLLRGSGEIGLAGMAPERSLGQSRLLRPLLAVAPEAIADYARRHALQWVEDPSNAQTQQDRNFLRHEILPALAERFPAAEANLARSAALLGEAAELLEPDFASLQQGAGLSLEQLAGCTEPQRNRLLLAWLRRQDLPLPRHRMLAQIWQQFLAAGADREPCVRWPGAELRRYRQQLYAMPPLPDVRVVDQPLAAAGEMLWPHGGRLVWSLPGPGRLCSPRGGERIRVGGHRRRLKSLFQQAGVPPWWRRRTPLLYLGDELVAVGNRWRADSAPPMRWEWHHADGKMPMMSGGTGLL